MENIFCFSRRYPFSKYIIPGSYNRISVESQPRITLSISICETDQFIVPHRKSFTSHCSNFDQLEDCFSSSSCFTQYTSFAHPHTHICIQFLFVFFYTQSWIPHTPSNHLCFSFYGSNNAQRRYLILCIPSRSYIHTQHTTHTTIEVNLKAILHNAAHFAQNTHCVAPWNENP